MRAEYSINDIKYTIDTYTRRCSALQTAIEHLADYHCINKRNILEDLKQEYENKLKIFKKALTTTKILINI
jgi:hypothetical protein